MSALASALIALLVLRMLAKRIGRVNSVKEQRALTLILLDLGLAKFVHRERNLLFRYQPNPK